MQNEAYRTDSHMFEMHVTSLMQEDSSRMQEEEQKGFILPAWRHALHQSDCQPCPSHTCSEISYLMLSGDHARGKAMMIDQTSLVKID